MKPLLNANDNVVRYFTHVQFPTGVDQQLRLKAGAKWERVRRHI